MLSVSFREYLHSYPWFAVRQKLNLSFFCSQLSRLLNAGYTLVEAIDSMNGIVGQSILRPLHNSVVKGKGLSKGMEFLPGIFSKDVINLVALGEQTGFLPQVLEAIACQQLKQKELTGKLRKTTLYPTIILGMGCLLVIYMIFFVLPSFQTIFADLDTKLPVTTRILLALPNNIGQYLLYLLLILALGAMSLIIILKQSKLIDWLSEQFWRLRPVKIYWLSKCFWLVSLSLETGIPLSSSLKQVRTIISSFALRQRWTTLHIGCKQGKAFHLAAAESGFPLDACSLLAVMEAHGDLAKGLSKISEQYQAELDFWLERLAALLEPASIIITGGLVGLIIFSLISPLTQLTQQLL